MSSEEPCELEIIESVEEQFEGFAHQNGMCYWLDTDMMRILGYSELSIFKRVIIKAMNTCTSLGFDPAEDFIQHLHTDQYGVNGSYKLSRFACLLIAQNANPLNDQVRYMQYSLARMADAVISKNDLDRIEVRTELSRGERELSGVAKSHGIGKGKYDYARFKDAGYRGMYNMDLQQLKRHKKFVPQSKNEVIYDRMNTTELAANLFRVTQTTEHIKNHNIQGQRNLELAANAVGKKVRDTMETLPEALPFASSTITEVKKIGKGAKKKMTKIDKSKPSSTC